MALEALADCPPPQAPEVKGNLLGSLGPHTQFPVPFHSHGPQVSGPQGCFSLLFTGSFGGSPPFSFVLGRGEPPPPLLALGAEARPPSPGYRSSSTSPCPDRLAPSTSVRQKLVS